MKRKESYRCQRYRAKTISNDTDAYQEEIDSFRDRLYRNNYPKEHKISAKISQSTTNNTPKLTTVCLRYVKGLAEKIQKIYSPYDIRTGVVL